MNNKSAYFRYIVRTERSLGELAQSCGCTVETLRQINKSKSDMLRRGQRVYLPYMECAGGFFYTLRKGQSLFGIAINAGLQIEDIIAANPGIALQSCIVGQLIVLPLHLAKEAPQTTQLQIRRGDTLTKVLQRSGHTIALLQLLNPGIPLNQLYIGQRLTVINFKKTVDIPGTYMLKQGDRLSEVAQAHGITVEDIRLANSAMRPQSFRPGVTIQLPVYRVAGQTT